MTTQEQLDWMIVDGADGLEILWFLICNEPFFWVLGAIGLGALTLSWWCDRYFKDANYSNNEHLR
tara:strand:+ start:319 stop:513 length:195 start_codon:yes stop_codon:yes gene_type:complete